jgi:hypothetical protein
MSRREFRLVKNVLVTDILLDVENARIRAGRDQSDCIARILRKEEQLLNLMDSIAREGLTTIPILVSRSKDRRHWIVRDGNRRITALKLLNDPALAPDARLREKIKALAKGHKVNIDKALDVLASDNEEAIVREVVARHSGAQSGAGQLDWSAYLRTIYLLHHEHPADYKRAAQYVFWAEQQGLSVDDEFPITTVHRFFTGDNLALLGFKVDKATDDLTPTLPVATAKAMAQRVINDFQLGRDRGGKSVDDVRAPDQARSYIDAVRSAAGLIPAQPSPAPLRFPAAPRPAPPKGPNMPPASGPIPSASPAPSPGSAPAPSPKTPPSERNKIFGRGSPNLAIAEKEHKARTIIAELRILSVKETPLAVAGLLRQLIEISDEHYRKKHHRVDATKLAKNVLNSATHMRDSGVLETAQFDAVSRLATTGGPSELLHIETLQKIMHRETHTPSYQVLNVFWNWIEDFVRACWVK